VLDHAPEGIVMLGGQYASLQELVLKKCVLIPIWVLICKEHDSG